MTPRFFSKAIPLSLFFVLGTWAQTTTTMAACNAGFDWNKNSLGQDACVIGATLDASCRGLAEYTYPPLNSSQYYLPPSATHDGDLTCDCNTVMYSLYMACASCQGGQIYGWTTWIAACESVYVSQYPTTIPQGTAVPYWAYFNITTLPNQTYTDVNAENIGMNPEQLPKAINTLTGISSTSGKSTITLATSHSSGGQPNPTTNSNNSSGNNSGNKTNVGAIVGGVVGSVVPLSILGFGVFFFMRSRQQKQLGRSQFQNQELDPPYKPHPPSMYGAPVTPVTAAPFTPYNPSDPSTFPPQSPPSSVTYTTPSHNPRGTYSGIPEV